MVCDKCNGKCCTEFVRFITAFDAVRITNALKIEPTYFIDYYPHEIVSIYPVFKLNGKDYVLGLDAKSGTIKDCIFLMNIGNTKRCGIHNFKPMNCKTYPFIFKNNELDFVEEFVCPKQWWPEGEEREEYIKHIAQFKEELKQYRKIIKLWNKNFPNGSFIEFLDFTFKEVEKRQGKEMEKIKKI